MLISEFHDDSKNSVTKLAQADEFKAIVSAVTNELRSYADRGIFSNFSVRPSGAGAGLVHYRFHWLTDSSFHIKLNPARRVLELQELLPAVPFRSQMDKAFRQFLTGRAANSVPEHRRLDDQRFQFKCSNRQQKLSVAITFAPGDAAGATRSAVNLIHEVFNNFLQDGPYQNYMVEVFNVAEE